MIVFVEEFRCHVIGSAAVRLSPCEGGSESEIDQLEHTLVVNDDILGFDVSVRNASFMEKANSLYDF